MLCVVVCRFVIQNSCHGSVDVCSRNESCTEYRTGPAAHSLTESRNSHCSHCIFYSSL